MTAFTVVPVTPDTDEWREERRNSLGASDIPNLMLTGKDSWGTPLEVYYSKMGVDKPFPEDRAFIGHALEGVMQLWLETFHPEVGPITPGFMARSIASPWLHASLDRMAGTTPIQMKAVGTFARADWEANAIPLKVQAQVQTEMYVLGEAMSYVVAIDGTWNFHLATVHRDQRFIDHMLTVTERFWRNHVLAKLPPEPVTSAEAATLWAPDDSVCEVPAEQWQTVWDLYERRRELEDDRRDIDGLIDVSDLAIKVMMREATTLAIQTRPLFTWKTNKKGVRVFNRVHVKDDSKGNDNE